VGSSRCCRGLDNSVEVVVLDTTTDKGRRVKVKDVLPKSSEVFATSAGLFVPDVVSGSVVRVDTRSGETEKIDVGVGKGQGNFEVFTKDGKLWVNNPNGSKAVVIDGRGEVHEVNKYDKDIEDVDPACDPECDAPKVDPAALSSPPVEGLTNGTTYRFTLMATNKDGNSEPASVEAKPLGDVPDQVTGVTAEAIRGTQPGVAGPVQVTWKPETSSGLPISGYTVTANDGTADIGTFKADGEVASIEIPAAKLGPMDPDAVGDFSFSVKAVSVRGGSELEGKASDPSGAVDLFTTPAVPSPSVTPRGRLAVPGLDIAVDRSTCHVADRW
jgi:hypothetical protein